MTPRFRAHAFQVSQFQGGATFLDVLQALEKTPLADRLCTINGVEIRAEHVVPSPDGAYWELDFNKFRSDHGPGRASPTQETSGIDFEDGECFSEETAALFIPASNHMLVQYNHHGPRVGAIEEYFHHIEVDGGIGVDLQPVLDPDTSNRYAKRSKTLGVKFKIAPQKLTAADRRGGASVGQLIDLCDQADGDIISVGITSRVSNGGLKSSVADKLIAAVHRLQSRRPESIKSLEARIVEGVDAKSVMLDLLEHRLVAVLEDIPVGKDLRMSREDRITALRRIRNGWKTQLASD